VIHAENGEVREHEQRLGKLSDIIMLQTQRPHAKTHGDGLRHGADGVEARVKMLQHLQSAELLWQVRERVAGHNECLEACAIYDDILDDFSNLLYT
jgi:hypothetical protein